MCHHSCADEGSGFPTQPTLISCKAVDYYFSDFRVSFLLITLLMLYPTRGKRIIEIAPTERK
jgi:hypothetical protein